MSLILHFVDAFTDRPFAGNPAAVCVLPGPVDERWMQLVAREMNLSETAFLQPIENGWSLRWLTPTVEVKLCGHATLASAFTLWETGRLRPDETARFFTSSGWLTCRRDRDWIEMDFPAQIPQPCAAPEGLAVALGCEPLGGCRSDMDYLVEIADETTLRALKPTFSALARLPLRGVIVTCRSTSSAHDFVSRYFAPAVGVNEDPVTGSTHCLLGPYWARKLGKSEFTACQASDRGGVIQLHLNGDRVLLRGQAVMMGKMELLHSSIRQACS